MLAKWSAAEDESTAATSRPAPPPLRDYAIRAPDGTIADVCDIGANLTKASRADVLHSLRRAASVGTRAVIITGTSVAVSRQARALCDFLRAQGELGLPRVYFTAGIHPHDAAKAPAGFVAALEELAASPLCVSIGEAGLDYDRMLSPREVQLAVLDAQCALAARLGKPLFAHCREVQAAYEGTAAPAGAYNDFLGIVRRYSADVSGASAAPDAPDAPDAPAASGGGLLPPAKVVVHCFTGNARELDALVGAGVCIGVTGFLGIAKRCGLTARALEEGGLGSSLLDGGRLLVETDAPFMLPDRRWLPRELASERRARCEVCVTVGVAKALAALLGRAEHEVARATSQAAEALFELSAADERFAAMPTAPCGAFAADHPDAALLPSDASSAVASEPLAPGSRPTGAVDGEGASSSLADGVVALAVVGCSRGGEGGGRRPRQRRGRVQHLGEPSAARGGPQPPPPAPVPAAEASEVAVPPALPPSLLDRPRRAVVAFGDDGTWVAADWHEPKAPRSFSGFFLPLIYSGIGSVGGVHAAAAHYGGRPKASAVSIEAAQPFWRATFSHWDAWVALVHEAAVTGSLSDLLGRGVSAKASTIVPQRLAQLEASAFGAVPHLKPQAQNDLLERALGPVESSRFYCCVMALHEH